MSWALKTTAVDALLVAIGSLAMVERNPWGCAVQYRTETMTAKSQNKVSVKFMNAYGRFESTFTTTEGMCTTTNTVGRWREHVYHDRRHDKYRRATPPNHSRAPDPSNLTLW